MDHAQAGGREAIQSTFSQCGADAALAHSVAASGGSFFRLLRGLRDYFLASNHSETRVGIFRREGRNAGCDPICCGVPRTRATDSSRVRVLTTPRPRPILDLLL